MRRARKATTATADRNYGEETAAARFAVVVLLVILLMSATGGVALAVVGGKTVSITGTPWTVVVREYEQQRCTGVIIDSSHILTAGHCVMYGGDDGDSTKPFPASVFGVEAGVSNFKHPLESDHPQFRDVIAVRAMPGYIAASKITSNNTNDAVGHDLAVLTLARPLDLHGDDARVAYLPSANTSIRSRETRLVLAGFGDETPTGYYENGTLNEVVKPEVARSCSTSQVLCMFAATSNICSGDSGSGAVEPGPHPTVFGILSEGGCAPGWDYYVSLTAPAALRFIRAST
jgi:hypothetical protein